MHNRYFKDMRVGILKFSVLGLRSLGAGNVEIRTHLSLRFTEVGQAPNESLSDKRLQVYLEQIASDGLAALQKSSRTNSNTTTVQNCFFSEFGTAMPKVSQSCPRAHFREFSRCMYFSFGG